MGGLPEDEEAAKCHLCGGAQEPVVTDLPFKTGEKRIVICKDVPVLQCGSCHEYVIEEADQQAELEIVRYAA